MLTVLRQFLRSEPIPWNFGNCVWSKIHLGSDWERSAPFNKLPKNKLVCSCHNEYVSFGSYLPNRQPVCAASPSSTVWAAGASLKQGVHHSQISRPNQWHYGQFDLLHVQISDRCYFHWSIQAVRGRFIGLKISKQKRRNLAEISRAHWFKALGMSIQMFISRSAPSLKSHFLSVFLGFFIFGASQTTQVWVFG